MDDNPAESHQNGSSKKFKPFKAFKRMFRDGKKTNSKRLSKENSTKGQGTSDLTVRLNRPLSLSHDSIFAAEIVMPESKGFGNKQDRCLSDENITVLGNKGKENVSQLQDQLKLKFGEGKGHNHISASEAIFSSAPSIIITKEDDDPDTAIDIKDPSAGRVSRNKGNMSENETQENDEKAESKEVSFDTMDKEGTEVLSNVAAYSKISSRPKNRRRGGKPPSMRNITTAPTFDSVFEQVTEERLVEFKDDDNDPINKETGVKSPKRSDEASKDDREAPSAPVKKSLSFKNHLGNPMMAPSLGDVQKIKLRKTNSSASAENRPQPPEKSSAEKSPKKSQKTASSPASKEEKSSAKSKGKKMNFFSKREGDKKTSSSKKGKEKKNDPKAEEEVFKSPKSKEKRSEKEEKSSPKEAKKEKLLGVADKRRRAVSSESEKPKKSVPPKTPSFNGMEDIKLKKVDAKPAKSPEAREEEPQENKFFKLKKVNRSDSGKDKSGGKKSPKTSESSEKISSPVSPKKALIPPGGLKSKKGSEKVKEVPKTDKKSEEKSSEAIKSPDSETKRPGLKFGPILTPKKDPSEKEPIKSPEAETKRPGLKFGPVVTPKKDPNESEAIKSPDNESKRQGLKFGPVVTPKKDPNESEAIKSPDNESKRQGLKFGPVVTPKKDPGENPTKPEMGKLRSKSEEKSPEAEKPAFPVKLKSTGHSARLFSAEENNNNVKPPLDIEKVGSEVTQKPVERKISHNRNNSNNNITLVETGNLNSAPSVDETAKSPPAKTPPKVAKKPTLNRAARSSDKRAGKESAAVEKENILSQSNKPKGEKVSNNGGESRENGDAPSWISLARKRSKKWESSRITPAENNAKEVKEPQKDDRAGNPNTETESKPSNPLLRPRPKPRTNSYQSSKSFEEKPAVPPKTLRPVSDGASLVGGLNPGKPSRSLSFKVPEQDTANPPPWLAIAMKKQKRWGKEEMV